MFRSILIITYLLSGSLGIPKNIDINSEYALSPRLKIQNVFQSELKPRIKISSEGTLIIGGEEATPHQFPFQVSIQVYQYLEEYVHICGGVIYDELHVITAAHCVRGFHPRNIRVIAGDHDLKTEEDAEQIRSYVEYRYHPGYDPLVFFNDIAFITVDTPFIFNNAVQPAVFPSTYIEASGRAVSTGWGWVEGDVPAPKLQFVELDVISREKCSDMYSRDVTDGMICVGDESGGKGSCFGDSGGPLLCKDENGKDYLCGLTSWGSHPCGQGRFPTVGTNIPYYLDWLRIYLPPQPIGQQ